MILIFEEKVILFDVSMFMYMRFLWYNDIVKLDLYKNKYEFLYIYV